MISEDGLLGSSGGSSGHGQSPGSREGRVPSLPQWNVHHHCPEHPSKAWCPTGTRARSSACRSQELRGSRGRGQWVPGKTYQRSCPGGGPGRGAGGQSKKGPRALLGGRGRKCSSPCRPSPHLQGYLCQKPHLRAFWPPLSSLIWARLSPRSLGEGTFGNTNASAGHGSSRPHRTTATLWKAGQSPGWQGRSQWHRSSPLCSPGWRSCQSDARQTPPGVQGHCISWQVHSLSGSRHSSSS